MRAVRERAHAVLHLIKNPTLLTPQPRSARCVVTAADRIIYVGDEVPSIDKRLLLSEVDLEGAYLIPGLVDIHAHITGGGGEAGFATQVPPVPLSDFTLAGVTTVVGLLGTDDVTRSTANLVARARGLREEGLSAYCYTGGYHWPATTLTGSVIGDITHIDCIVGLGELAISDHRSSQLSAGELAKAAGEAHVAGLMTGKAGIAHLHLGDGARGLALAREVLETTEIPARVLNPTHCNRTRALFDEACDLSRRGCWIDVTAFPVAEDEDAWSAEAALARFLDAGCPPDRISISTDAGGCLCDFDELGKPLGMDYGRASALSSALAACARRVGLEAALPAFTSNPASLMRFHRKGQISEGSDADLIVLASDFSVQHVMALGQWMVRDGAPLRRGTFEAAAT